MPTTIQNVRAIATPQKSYEWEVSVLGLSTGSPISGLTAYAKTVNIPSSSVDQVRIPFKSSNTYFAGRDSSPHTVSISFWDDEAGTIRNYFENWYNLLLHNSVTGGQSPHTLYVATLDIKLFDSTDTNITSEIQLTGAWPQSINDISLNYDASDPIDITVGFVYDVKQIIK